MRQTDAPFLGHWFFYYYGNGGAAIMKDTRNNEAKEKRFVDVDAIEKVIAVLPLLTRQG